MKIYKMTPFALWYWIKHNNREILTEAIYMEVRKGRLKLVHTDIVIKSLAARLIFL